MLKKSHTSSDVPLPPPPDPHVYPAGYLKSIYAVRQRCKLVYEKVLTNELHHFTVDNEKFADTAEFIVKIIKRDFEPNFSKIPPHGRWQHFNVGEKPRNEQLIASWPSSVDKLEQARRLIDLFVVSVLLDAGAGTRWTYVAKDINKTFKRSERLAVASLDMFKAGLFSSNPKQPHQVDTKALQNLAVDHMAVGLQVTDINAIEGLEGRTSLLIRLGESLKDREIFGETARPGNMLDYLLAHSTTHDGTVTLPTIWDTLMTGLVSIWPATRTQIAGVAVGDAWPCTAMPSDPAEPWKNIVPFHKLTQWLTYSIIVPMQKLAGIKFVGIELLTGLPEYRNGGLLVDTGLPTLKPGDLKRGIEQYHMNASRGDQPNIEVVPLLAADDDVIVEWRALTVCYLDQLLIEVNKQLGLEGDRKLSLAQMLEAGSWKGGREIAEIMRPITKGPPIMILSDGTVF